MDDLPVLGPPIRPTEICFRSECREENWRRSWIREPFPKELLMLAWNARVGYSLERRRTQEAYDELVFNFIKLSINASAMSKVCMCHH